MSRLRAWREGVYVVLFESVDAVHSDLQKSNSNNGTLSDASETVLHTRGEEALDDLATIEFEVPFTARLERSTSGHQPLRPE